MDLTPSALRETTFRGALRGYNVDDVDEFVERVAVGVGELLDQLRLTSERAAAADRRAREVATSEDAMKRTLGHAQKLAEAVVTEARQEAARVTDDARQAAAVLQAGANDEVAGLHEAAEQALAEAEGLQRAAEAERIAVRADAEAIRAAARAEAEAERSVAKRHVEVLVARAAEGIDAELRKEMERLHGVRQQLQLDVAVLTSWMHEQRASVRTVLVDTLAAIDRSTRSDDPPVITEVDLDVHLGAGWTAPAPPTPEPVSVVATVPLPDPDAVVETDRAEPDEEAPPTFPELSDEEFLAELRKAADGTDDPSLGPFGPGTSF